MKCYVSTRYYGGDVNILEQAAKDCGVQLVAVKGYALDDFPGDRNYVEGDYEYLFLIEADSPRSAYHELTQGRISRRIQELFREKYPN